MSGAILQPSLTLLHITKQSVMTPSTSKQLQNQYRGLPWDPEPCCGDPFRRSFYRALRSTESNVALRSTKPIQSGLWNSFLCQMMVFNVTMRSTIARSNVNPLCDVLRWLRTCSKTKDRGEHLTGRERYCSSSSVSYGLLSTSQGSIFVTLPVIIWQHRHTG